MIKRLPFILLACTALLMLNTPLVYAAEDPRLIYLGFEKGNDNKLSEVLFPLSGSSFKLNKDNWESITLDFTELSNISDIRDTDGDGEALHSTVTITDIYRDKIDITEKIQNPDEALDWIAKAEKFFNPGNSYKTRQLFNAQNALADA